MITVTVFTEEIKNPLDFVVFALIGKIHHPVNRNVSKCEIQSLAPED